MTFNFEAEVEAALDEMDEAEARLNSDHPSATITTAGGCDHCDAETTVQLVTEHIITAISVAHDAWCPALARIERGRERRAALKRSRERSWK